MEREYALGLLRLAVVSVLAIAVYAAVLGCTDGSGAGNEDSVSGPEDVITDTSFMADIVGNIVGERLTVASLIPEGAEPHTFEPTPRDAQRLAECRVLVINVDGLVPAVDDLIAGTRDEDQPVIVAAEGLADLDDDPHCWLDPVLVTSYVENIWEGLAAIDPAGAETYRVNAEAYEEGLADLDSWIVSQVETIPEERRLLVTNHESLGRFAARYGFRVVGAVYPTTAGEGSPSARGVAQLIETIRQSGAPAVFVEIGSSRELAEQVADATDAVLVADLYTHSLGPEAPTYIEMMRWNVTRIVEALQ